MTLRAASGDAFQQALYMRDRETFVRYVLEATPRIRYPGEYRPRAGTAASQMIGELWSRGPAGVMSRDEAYYGLGLPMQEARAICRPAIDAGVLVVQYGRQKRGGTDGYTIENFRLNPAVRPRSGEWPDQLTRVEVSAARQQVLVLGVTTLGQSVVLTMAQARHIADAVAAHDAAELSQEGMAAS